jgi:hypothetical protein
MQCKPAFNAECNFHKPAVCAAITNRLHDHFFYSLHPAAAMHLNAILRLRQPRALPLSAATYQCAHLMLLRSYKYRMLGGGACGSVQKNAPGKINICICINSPLASVAESVYFESAQAIISIAVKCASTAEDGAEDELYSVL